MFLVLGDLEFFSFFCTERVTASERNARCFAPKNGAQHDKIETGGTATKSLRVIHLPGHTQGHCGFYSQRFSLLFTGDLFASYPGWRISLRHS